MVEATYPFPGEIFAAAVGEFEHSGIYVLSEFSTVPRWEGDTERDRDWQRYVDADVHDSLKRYHDHMVQQLSAEISRLRKVISVSVVATATADGLDSEQCIELNLYLTNALRGLSEANRVGDT